MELKGTEYYDEEQDKMDTEEEEEEEEEEGVQKIREDENQKVATEETPQTPSDCSKKKQETKKSPSNNTQFSVVTPGKINDNKEDMVPRAYYQLIDNTPKPYSQEEYKCDKGLYGDDLRTVAKEVEFFYRNIMLIQNVNSNNLPAKEDIMESALEAIQKGTCEPRILEFIMNIQNSEKANLGPLANLPNPTWKQLLCDCLWKLKEQNQLVICGPTEQSGYQESPASRDELSFLKEKSRKLDDPMAVF